MLISGVSFATDALYVWSDTKTDEALQIVSEAVDNNSLNLMGSFILAN